MAGLPSPGTIETERLTLAPLVEADVDGLHALFTDPGVRRFMWDDRVIDRETVAEICDASSAASTPSSSGSSALGCAVSRTSLG